jgi:hypothetical protein
MLNDGLVIQVLILSIWSFVSAAVAGVPAEVSGPLILLLLLWCGVAQLVARRLAGRQARVRFPARHHREVFPTEPQAMRRWREASANVLYECDWMIVLYECYKI